MAELNINELQRRSEITKYGHIVSPRLKDDATIDLLVYQETALNSVYKMHPRPVWYVRPYWWLRCWLKR